MIVTGAFFADAVQAADGKLNVLGGVWSWFPVEQVGAEAPVSVLHLVVLLQGGDDAETDSVHIEVLGPDGNALFDGTGATSLPVGVTLGFTAIRVEIRFESLGQHVFILTGSSGTPLSLPLDVRLAQH